MDHERVNISTLDISCGVMGLSRISDDTEAVLYAIASRLYHPSRGQPCAQFVWSDVTDEDDGGYSNGEKLANVIKDLRFHKGVTVLRTVAVENPRTGNHIYTWVWTVDHAEFKAWYAEQRVLKMKKVGT